MAIEQFGQSLLAGQRQRQRRVAKQQRRLQREATFGALGGAIANQFLKNKKDEFLNSEANNALKIKYKEKIANGVNAVDIYGKALLAEGGPDAYIKEQRKNYLIADAQKTWGDQYKEFDEKSLNIFFDQEAEKWTKQNIDLYKKAYESGLQMGTLAEFQEARANGYEGPENVAQLITRGIASTFMGQTPASSKATAARNRADAMMEAGRQVETYQAAINKGYDINTADLLQEALDAKRISMKQDKIVSEKFEEVPTYINGVRVGTDQIKKITKERADGSTYEVLEGGEKGPTSVSETEIEEATSTYGNGYQRKVVTVTASDGTKTTQTGPFTLDPTKATNNALLATAEQNQGIVDQIERRARNVASRLGEESQETYFRYFSSGDDLSESTLKPRREQEFQFLFSTALDISDSFFPEDKIEQKYAEPIAELLANSHVQSALSQTTDKGRVFDLENGWDLNSLLAETVYQGQTPAPISTQYEGKTKLINFELLTSYLELEKTQPSLIPPELMDKIISNMPPARDLDFMYRQGTVAERRYLMQLNTRLYNVLDAASQQGQNFGTFVNALSRSLNTIVGES